jgi:hypothetical protein
MAHDMSLGEDFEILLRAIEEANLRIVDDHRDVEVKWVKVRLPDAGKQARVLFWIVPERGVPPWRSPRAARVPRPAGDRARRHPPTLRGGAAADPAGRRGGVRGEEPAAAAGGAALPGCDLGETVDLGRHRAL